MTETMPPARTWGRVNLAGVEVDCLSFAQVVAHLMQIVQAHLSPAAYVTTANAQHILLWQQDPGFRAAYAQAHLVVADGVSLLWAAKLLGTPLRGRVNGTDLFVALCGAAAEAGRSVYFLGGRPGAAQMAADRLRTTHPALVVTGIDCPPHGFEVDDALDGAVLARIEQAAPDLLFVGLGAPKQERWIHRHAIQLGGMVCVGIGGSFELVAGMLPRSPGWMQRSGLEWLWRLAQEPGRLGRRYLLGNPRFVWLILKQRLRLGRGQGLNS